jgi:adenine deaminase
LAAGGLGDFWCLVTDDIFPDDLRRHGHLDGLLRRVVAGGVPPASAVRHATLIPARHYGLSDRGAVAPGYRADLLVVDDVRDFRSHLVLKDGEIVARGEKLATDLRPPKLTHENTIRCAPLEASAFQLRLPSDRCPVIRIVPGQIVTRHETQQVRPQGGHWVFDPDRDVILIASIERHRATGEIGLGLVSGFGLRRPGALGSSVAHDSHNLIVAGTNGEDMLACVRALEKTGGGFVVSAEGTVHCQLPLPIAGLLSEASVDTVCQQLQQVHEAARSLGCELTAPFGTLSFLALPVIPELRITTQGLFDVSKQEFIRA